MNDKTNSTDLDLAQRIVEYLGRTTKPKDSSDGTNKGFAVIGTVPEHLRHLHNLLCDLDHEAKEAEIAFQRAKNRHQIIHGLFFESLETHVPDPEGVDGIMILANWDVVAMVRDEKDGMRSRISALFGGMRN